MNLNIFGFKLTKDDGTVKDKVFTPSMTDDGTSVVNLQNGAISHNIDLEGQYANDAALITKYRQMSILPEIDGAVDEIVNEAIAGGGYTVKVNINTTDFSKSVKDKTLVEFKHILSILNFNNNSYDIFRRWYIDGRIYFFKVMDQKNQKDGIKEVRFIDPRKIKKIKEVTKEKDKVYNINLIKKEVSYYLYNDEGFLDGISASGIHSISKISDDSICYAPSGLVDEKRSNTVISFLHKAIKPLNQLRMLEDATVIYRLARAPERRVFYVDVGNLPKVKAEQYIKDLMNSYKNRLVYDTETGDLRDDKKTLSMLEDFWMPRREGGKGTEIDTLKGGMNLGEITDVMYFQRKLYKSLHLPINRIDENNSFGIGRTTEITREEVKFSHFIDRLRQRFSLVFDDLLGTQLIAKNIVTAEEWLKLKEHITYDFSRDSVFNEIKEIEILKDRLEMVAMVAPYSGKYFSDNYIRKTILRQSDEDIKIMDAEISKEHAILEKTASSTEDTTNNEKVADKQTAEE